MLIRRLVPRQIKTRIKHAVKRVRFRRHRQYIESLYNKNRYNYYVNSTVRMLKDNTKKVSIVVPCYNTPKKYFEPLLASIFSQGYQNWELVVVDASDSESSQKYLNERSQADTRITYLKVDNMGIAINTNVGIQAAKGDFIAFLDHDDTLDPDALADTMKLFIDKPDLSLVYTDEDKVDDDGERYFEPHFKPDFSIDMLRNVNYITHFVVAKRPLVEKLGGIREGFDGAQDYDFLLRAVDENIKIGHVPKVLYHWRQAEGSTAADFSNKKHVTDAGCRALEDHYSRNGIGNVRVIAIENRPGFYRPIYALDPREKREIVLNISYLGLSPREREFILGKYLSNEDVKKYKISVRVDDEPSRIKGNKTTTLVVKGVFIPRNTDTDIASLFGLAEEAGVAGVSPKIVRQGRVYDMGMVEVGGEQKALFKGVNPESHVPFGSLEWVRDVSKLTGNVIVSRPGKKDGRNVIWTHSEFEAVEISNQNNGEHEPSTPNFYNPNIDELTEIITRYADYIETQDGR